MRNTNDEVSIPPAPPAFAEPTLLTLWREEYRSRQYQRHRRQKLLRRIVTIVALVAGLIALFLHFA